MTTTTTPLFSSFASDEDDTASDDDIPYSNAEACSAALERSISSSLLCRRLPSCLICHDPLRAFHLVWSCSASCHAFFHLPCIQSWARHPNWPCPKYRSPYPKTLIPNPTTPGSSPTPTMRSAAAPSPGSAATLACSSATPAPSSSPPNVSAAATPTSAAAPAGAPPAASPVTGPSPAAPTATQ